MEPRQQRYRQKMNFVLDKLPLERVKKDLAKLQGHQVVLFGSYVSGRVTPCSDIDVGIVTGISNPNKIHRIFHPV